MTSKISVSPNARRAIGIAVAGALVVAAIVFAALAPRQGRAPTGSAAGFIAATPSVRSATPTPSVDSTGAPSGPGTTEPGISMRFSPRTDGGFDVAERVILRRPATRIVLTPPAGGSAGSSFTRSRPVVTGLQMQDKSGQPLAPTRLGSLTQSVTVPLATATTELVLRYELAGTSVRSIPSTAGRALGFLRPVTAGVDPTLPVQISSVGAGVLNISCPQLPPDQRACAAGSAPAMSVRSGMTAASSTVVIQFNVPEP
jgi:hypothetical protein